MVMDISAARIWGFGAISLTGVDIGNPDDTAVTNITDNNNVVDGETGTVASETGDMVLGYIARRNINDLTPVGGQSDRYEFVTNHATGSSNLRGIGATEPGATSVVVEWDSAASAAEWATVGINVNAAVLTSRRAVGHPKRLLKLEEWIAPARRLLGSIAEAIGPAEAHAQSQQIVPAAWFYKDATDCTTDATIALKATLDQRCIDLDSGAEWRCSNPSLGGGVSATKCDQAAEWAAIGAGGSGNATQLQGRALDADAPTDTYVMTWNAGANEWQALVPASPVGGATLTGAQTLTNKTLTAPILNVPAASTLVINVDGLPFMTINSATGVIDYGSTFEPMAPISWTPNSVEVDGTGCTAPISEQVNSSEPLRNFACADGGKFSGQFVLPLAYSTSTALNFRVKARSIGTSSTILALDVSAWCRSVNDTINNTYGTAASCDITTGVSPHEIKQCEVDFTPNTACAGGDVVSWRAVVDSATNTATAATAKILGGHIRYGKRRDRE